MSKDLNNIIQLIQHGEYSKATEGIQHLLDHDTLSKEEREIVQFELERMSRIQRDFSSSTKKVLEFIRAYYPGVQISDLDRWEQERSLECRVIDGEKYFFDLAARNLFRIDPNLRKIWEQFHPDSVPDSGSGARGKLDKHNSLIIRKASEAQQPFVLPQRLRIKQSLVVLADAVPHQELIRCWLPFPRTIENHQEDIQLVHSQPADHFIAPPESLQRTIYMEKPALAGKQTLFSVEYELCTYGIYHRINPESVAEVIQNDSLQQYLQEDPPHIVFSPALRELSRQIVGAEKNPYRKSQLIFAWMNKNIPWASAREYSTLRCIPEYALLNRHGDCGIQTLLFITLCRLNNIPARWQSGWELQPPDDSMHDWGMIYFESYGWVPVDITYGLRKSSDPQLKWFYLGGLDGYRIIFNDALAQTFTPPKQHIRSDTLDNQRGEIEWSEGNLYFDQWEWKFEWEILEKTSDNEKSIDKQ